MEVDFFLKQRGNYGLDELSNLLPWEREIHLHMLVQYLKEKQEREEQAYKKT
jgi:hypothetical protein